jgi:hypothetical protein
MTYQVAVWEIGNKYSGQWITVHNVKSEKSARSTVRLSYPPDKYKQGKVKQVNS